MKLRSVLKLVIVLVFGIFSCSKEEGNTSLTKPPVEILVNEMVRKASLVNQEIPFAAFDEEGKRINDATFYVNGKEWKGDAVFKSSEVGVFNLKAVYKNKAGEDITKEEEFRVVVPARNIVVDDFTGAWCQYCPQVNLALEELKTKTKHVIPVAIHVPGNPEKLDYDKHESVIKATGFKIGTYPTAVLNRNSLWDVDKFPSKTDYSPITSIAGKPINIGMGIYANLVGNSLKAQVRFAYGAGEFSEGDKLVVYLLEDKIVHIQINGFKGLVGHPLEFEPKIMEDFVHNEVLRKSLTAVDGSPIKSAEALKEKISNFEETVQLGDTPGEDYKNYNKNNLVLVAMIVGKDKDGKLMVKHAQSIHVKPEKETFVYYNGLTEADY